MDVIELIRNDQWMDENFDSFVLETITKATFYPTPTKKGFGIMVSAVCGQDVVTGLNKKGIEPFLESLFWMCDKEAVGSYDIECAKRWLKMLKKTTKSLEDEIKKAEK